MPPPWLISTKTSPPLFLLMVQLHANDLPARPSTLPTAILTKLLTTNCGVEVNPVVL